MICKTYPINKYIRQTSDENIVMATDNYEWCVKLNYSFYVIDLLLVINVERMPPQKLERNLKFFSEEIR